MREGLFNYHALVFAGLTLAYAAIIELLQNLWHWKLCNEIENNFITRISNTEAVLNIKKQEFQAWVTNETDRNEHMKKGERTRDNTVLFEFCIWRKKDITSISKNENKISHIQMICAVEFLLHARFQCFGPLKHNSCQF